MRIICINGEWYVYLAGPFGSLEAAEQKKAELEAEEDECPFDCDGCRQ